MMSLPLFISLLLAAFVLGLLVPKLHFVAKRALQRQRRPVVVPPGESGREQYQRYKAGLNLPPIEPPPGGSPEEAGRFRLLSPFVQRKVMVARKQAGIDG